MPNYVHQVCRQLRDLRRASRQSLIEAGQMLTVSPIVLGSYERGDRQATLQRMEAILNGYGYTLVAVPKDFSAVRLPGDMAQELRAIADQLEKEIKRNDVSSVS